jgi:sortase (surface protein transpeptidase)
MNRIRANLFSNILIAIAVGLLVIGITTSLNVWHSNMFAAEQAARLESAAIHSKHSNVPTTIKPTDSTLASYSVAGNLPRYLIIPKLGVDARVLSVGVDASGALETPSNVFDTAWYDQSAQPGQPGAVLIDGHISSWTAHGVFYGLNSLLPGDNIEVQAGNGTNYNYQVVETKVYPASNVDMVAAMKSINPTKPGLNLISCTGSVIPGTNDFSERIIVFATEQ